MNVIRNVPTVLTHRRLQQVQAKSVKTGIIHLLESPVYWTSWDILLETPSFGVDFLVIFIGKSNLV